jgi:hypothetical protein
MNIKLQIFFLVLIGIIFLIEAIWILKTENRLKRFFVGKKAKNLEDVIFNLKEEIEKLQVSKNYAEKEIIYINEKLKKSIRGLEIVRFNPFADQGSNQSFAIGMLDGDNDGVILSSLYSRERMSVFAKPIKNGKSKYELTKEEKEVLKKAEVNK